jgi:hypothetical protein
MKSRFNSIWLLAGALFTMLSGCSADDNGAGGTGGGGGTAGTEATGSGGAGGTSLKAFAPPVDPGKGGILFSASGEVLAQSGYAFPPASPNDAQFYDGWQIRFDRLLVTFDKIVLSANPDKDLGDQSKTDAPVAEVDGPWAVDVHRETSNNIDGKSPGERSVPIAALLKQSNGAPFATDARYAFGFDTVAATHQAYNVNLDAAGLSDYEEMVTQGCVVMYVGVATFKGDAACNAGHESWPSTVNFRLCFKSPATYVNCQNPDNMGTPITGEDAQRGIMFDANASVMAQVTFHTDHPFWDSVLHDSPAHFDQFAARALNRDGGTPLVTLEDTKGVDYTAYQDSLGNAVAWRYCSDPPTDVHPKFTGPMAFDPEGVPHATGKDAASGLRDYYDFATYNQSTQGHLNADGLCFVRRNYPSPN